MDILATTWKPSKGDRGISPHWAQSHASHVMPRLLPWDARCDSPQSAPLDHRNSVCSFRQHATRKPGALVIGGVSLLPKLNLQRIKSCLYYEISQKSESTRFKPRHHQMWSILLQPLHAGCDAETSPLAAPRTITAGLVRSPEASYVWTPPSSGQRASWRNAAQSTPACCYRNRTRNKLLTNIGVFDLNYQ